MIKTTRAPREGVEMFMAARGGEASDEGSEHSRNSFLTEDHDSVVTTIGFRF